MDQPEMQITEYQERQLWGLWCRCTPATAAHSARRWPGTMERPPPRKEASPPFPFTSSPSGEGKREWSMTSCRGNAPRRGAGGVSPAGRAVRPDGGAAPVGDWGVLEQHPGGQAPTDAGGAGRRGYRFLGLEYQLHTEESLRRPPVVQLVMAVEAVEKESEEP